MTSFLAWIDHDPAERERANRILALFQEKESRDELGLGAIRDSIADQLFPGTSTIQTRLRYFLFIPWIYQSLAHEGTKAAELDAKLRRSETALVEALLAEGETIGVFGRRARGGLKRLPSSIYWAGLSSWGIRRFDASQDEFHRAFDALHRTVTRHRQRREDEEHHDEAPPVQWDPHLPTAPAEFPDHAKLSLRPEEAFYLQDRIAQSNPESLLAWLVQDAPSPAVEAPWMHPRFAAFRDVHRELLLHARCFTEAMFGAAALYNLMLAEKKQSQDWIASHRATLDEWVTGLHEARLGDWSLDRFFALVGVPGHAIGPRTHDFVTAWVELARTHDAATLTGQAARRLIYARETSLKGAHSRLTNAAALTQWSGASGLGRMTYRWPTAQRFLAEIHVGLGVVT